jgi:hypothetical protein
VPGGVAGTKLPGLKCESCAIALKEVKAPAVESARKSCEPHFMWNHRKASIAG